METNRISGIKQPESRRPNHSPQILGHASIELIEVSRGCDGQLIVRIEDRNEPGRQWLVELRAADLQSFRRFREVVADLFGLWVHHLSQSADKAILRDDAWINAVSEAFDAWASR